MNRRIPVECRDKRPLAMSRRRELRRDGDGTRDAVLSDKCIYGPARTETFERDFCSDSR